MGLRRCGVVPGNRKMYALSSAPGGSSQRSSHCDKNSKMQTHLPLPLAASRDSHLRVFCLSNHLSLPRPAVNYALTTAQPGGNTPGKAKKAASFSVGLYWLQRGAIELPRITAAHTRSVQKGSGMATRTKSVPSYNNSSSVQK